MSKIVNIIVDASGSMAEDDKNAVVKYLINGICNAKQTIDFKDIEFVLYQWGKNSYQFESIEKAKIEFAGRTIFDDFNALSYKIDKNLPLVLISDGGFSKNDKAKIKKISSKLIPIFVGVDSNRTILRDIATDKIVYSVTDFMQALNEAKI